MIAGVKSSAVLSALLILLPWSAPAADDLPGAIRELARRTIAFAGRGEPVSLNWQNLSPLSAAEFSQLRAAMEAASQGIPALAASLETDRKEHFSYSREIDFTTAAYFTAYFARKLLEKRFPADVDLIKVDVPCDATPETAWQVSHLAHQRYFVPVAVKRKSWEERGSVDYEESAELENEHPDSDVYVLRVKRLVSVTPLSLDMTSRVDPGELDRLLRA